MSWNNELAFSIPTWVCCSNNVKWDIFVFKVLIKVLLSMHKDKIMQHCSSHNNDEGIRQGGAQSQVKYTENVALAVQSICQ